MLCPLQIMSLSEALWLTKICAVLCPHRRVAVRGHVMEVVTDTQLCLVVSSHNVSLSEASPWKL